MRKTQTLTISLLIGVMAIHLAAFAQAAPTKAVVKALVVEARASAAGTPYSKYNISANTTDGGRVEFLFVWQRSIEWNLKGFSGKLIVDTQPILHMAKYNKNGTLEVSLSYVPLFVMQYNDSDGNGLFDLWTRGGKGFDDEVEDDEIAWEHLKDRPYRIYPLAPMFHMIFRQSKWEWTVSSLVNRTIVVNNTQVEEFSWNITATVPSIPWQHAEVDEEERLRRRGLEWTTIDITLGYHVKLLPENPEVKYDLAFANINWADAENLRLAMISAILYRDVEPVVVKLGSRGLKVFNQTLPAREPLILVSEKSLDAAKAFVSYTSEADVDGRTVADAMRTAIHPVFLLPTPIIVPESLYTTGIITEIEGRPARNRIVFAHQVSVPRFNNSLTHDPTVAIAAQLSTVTLSTLPSDLISFRMLIVVAAAATVVAAGYVVVSRSRRRSTTLP